MANTGHSLKNLLLLLLGITILSTANAANENSFLLGAAPHRPHSLEAIKKIGVKNQIFAEMFVKSYHLGFRPLTSSWGNEDYRDLKIVPLTNTVVTKAVLDFSAALESEKKNLMKIYKLRNATYNKLAAMALGIFGNETEFGTSTRLKLKENLQGLVVLGKIVKGQDDLTTSRGLTQIKDLPEKIVEHYPDIKPSTLLVPANAAIATIGYLTEAFSMLLARDDLDNINASNVFDYMPYVYSGQMHKVIKGTATVVDNIYVVNMKRNIRKFYFMELKAAQ